MSFFSIIIPVYNVAPYLRECLDSVLAQTFADWEAVCVDDGSTDGSGAILDEYARKDKRFKVVHQENAGVSAARNAAIDMATGSWVGFLDADDVWAEGWLESVAKACDDDVDWVRAGWTNWQGETRTARLLLPEKVGQTIRGANLIDVGWWLVSRCAFPVVSVYRREILKDVLFPTGIRIREDALFCFEMVTRAHALRLVGATGYYRRIRENSAFHSDRRHDDTLCLLNAFQALWHKLRMTNAMSRRVRPAVVDATTYWVAKDVREWFCHCRIKTVGDVYAVWRIVRKLLNEGIISRHCVGMHLENVRWNIYLSTGWGRIFNINRSNLLGRSLPSARK